MMRLVCLFILVMLALRVVGQGVCSQAKLVGKWALVRALPNRPMNMDSIMAAIDTSLKGNGISTFNFRDDGTYDVRQIGVFKGDTIIFDNGKGHYSVVEADCEIWFNKKPHHGQVWHILFLNEKFLVFRYRNPKHEEVHLYRRE